MFLIKIFHFLKGYVILSIIGYNKEEFLNEMLCLGLRPRNIEYHADKIFFTVSIDDFFKLKRSSVPAKIHIEKRCGMVFLFESLKKRPLYALGVLIFALTFAVSSQFVWSIEYEGVKNCDINQLKSAVTLSGLKVGMPKAKLNEPLEMKNIILNHTDNICWAWVYVKGTKAIVKVREDYSAPEVFDKSLPCDIVAAKDGIIESVTAKQGKCEVSKDTPVASGDVIISGTYQFENEPGYQVHAQGSVLAHTEYEESGTYKQFYCYRTYTGRKRNFLSLQLFNIKLPICINRDIKFSEYDYAEKSHVLPFGNDAKIGFTTTSYTEYITQKEPISQESTIEFAKRELEEKIAKNLLPGSVLEDEDLYTEAVDNETVFIQLKMKFIEQIGTEKQISEVEFIEPTTDNSATGD